MKKNLAVLKEAMTRKNASWSSRGWHTKTGSQHSLVDDGGQNSQDRWKKPAPYAKWKEVSRLAEELEMLAKDKKEVCGFKKCKESSKRESEVLDMAEN